MRPPSAIPKTTRYRSEVRSCGTMVCIHTRVKRRTSRERSVLKVLSAKIMADDLHVDLDRKSTRLNSSHANISYAVFCLKKKKVNKEKVADIRSTICDC